MLIRKLLEREGPQLSVSEDRGVDWVLETASHIQTPAAAPPFANYSSFLPRSPPLPDNVYTTELLPGDSVGGKVSTAPGTEQALAGPLTPLDRDRTLPCGFPSRDQGTLHLGDSCEASGDNSSTAREEGSETVAGGTEDGEGVRSPASCLHRCEGGGLCPTR